MPRSEKPRSTKRSPTWHVRPFFNELNEPAWVLIYPASEPPPALRTVPIYGKSLVCSPNPSVRFISIEDEYRPNTRSCCPACLADEPCQVWIADPVVDSDYERRKPHELVKLTPEQRAAALLGVEWPCTEERLTIAFREAALKAHPDHGGSDEVMKRVIEARRLLTAARAGEQ